MKPRHSLSKLTPIRKHLRNNGTSAEAYLWNYLKQAQLEGRKFRRQHSIEYFIVDFFYSEMLVVELDGEYHLDYKQQERDKERGAFLRSVGITVLRLRMNMYLRIRIGCWMRLKVISRNKEEIPCRRVVLR